MATVETGRVFWVCVCGSFFLSFCFCEVNELREDVPLKATERRNRLCVCNEDCLGGSKFINVSFGALTVIITVALLVQIYYGDYQVRMKHSLVLRWRQETVEEI